MKLTRLQQLLLIFNRLGLAIELQWQARDYNRVLITSNRSLRKTLVIIRNYPNRRWITVNLAPVIIQT